jgi:hypothetical protein
MGARARGDVEPAIRSKAISQYDRPFDSGRSLKRRERAKPAKERTKKLSIYAPCYTGAFIQMRRPANMALQLTAQGLFVVVPVVLNEKGWGIWCGAATELIVSRIVDNGQQIIYIRLGKRL